MLFRYFATAGADRKIKIWEISKGINVDLKCTLAGSNAAVMGVDFDTTGSMILGASNDFATRIWSIEDSRLRHTLTGEIVVNIINLTIIKNFSVISKILRNFQEYF